MRITRMQRTIAAGILVEERRKMAPLAAHPPWLEGHDRVADRYDIANVDPSRSMLGWHYERHGGRAP
jgi:hypothetical protein